MRGSVRRGATGAALAALVLGGGVVACAKSDESPKMTPAAAVAAAAKNTEAITSLTYRMTGKVPETGRVEAEAAMSMKPLAMSMKMNALDQGADGKMEIRVVDKAMYLGGGQAVAKELDGKSWMKFDLSGAASGPGAGKLPSQAGQDPSQESTYLTGSKDVKKVGTEKVDGVRTTHYKGTVTLDDLRASLKDEDKATREKREKSLKQYEDLGADKLTMDMWIGPDDHTKQVRVRAAADKGPFDVTLTFLDYNKPVTVKAPPAKDTVDLAAMMKDAQAG
ncbi:LppX_LprAFG lipoprotein [Streptomyces sp. NPDC057950]|uniref:LppX_LprAFG lipoprotein n=1 Tax=Streptomyces sp. NPDC057950 TaxID=3346288 RepID=UPI0036EA49EA